MTVTPIVVRGDARALPLPDCSVDAVICDPPYELSFMGRSWDSTGVAFDTEPWREALRVLKPGGHLAAFGATRTYHRLGCAIEDAGFEIRDSIRAGVYAWVHGQGFPKSLDVGKAIDKVRYDKADVLAVGAFLAEAISTSGKPRREIAAHFGMNPRAVDLWAPGPNDRAARQRAAVPTCEQWRTLRDLLDMSDSFDAEVARLNARKGSPGEAWSQRELLEAREGRVGFDPRHAGGGGWSSGRADITAPATEEARAWDGWGTALKPAWEPIVVARKALDGTVAASVLGHGTGAINIDATRVAANDESDGGRFPSNLLLSHHPACGDGCHGLCHVRALDEQSGIQRDGVAVQRNRAGEKPASVYGKFGTTTDDQGYGSGGGASRYYPTFRYEPKAPTWQRPQVDGRGFETVKPLDLMRWLVRLLTPPGGLVLDMFPGTGTTGQAAQLEGFRSLLVELEVAHIPFIRERLAQQVVVDRKTDEAVPVTLAPDDALSLFDLEAS